METGQGGHPLGTPGRVSPAPILGGGAAGAYFSWTRSYLLCSRSPYSRLWLCSLLLAGNCLAAAGRGNRMGALTPGHTDPKFTSISTKGPLNGGAGVPERSALRAHGSGGPSPLPSLPFLLRGSPWPGNTPPRGLRGPTCCPVPTPTPSAGGSETLGWWRPRSLRGERGGQPFAVFLPGAPSLSAFSGRPFVPSPGASIAGAPGK